jgi:hypothetical protein
MSLFLAETIVFVKRGVTPADRLVALLAEIEKHKYYGEVVLKFENGQLCHGKITETILFKG